MKRAFTCALLLFWALSTYVVFDYFSQMDFAVKAGNENPIITIDKAELSDDDFLSLIYKKCAQYNVNLTTSYYPNSSSVQPNELFTVVQYTTDFSKYKKWLTHGHLPVSTNEFITTTKLNDKNVTGLISFFNKNYSIDIFYLNNQFPFLLSRDYQIDANNSRDINLFIESLKQNGISCTEPVKFTTTTVLIGNMIFKIILLLMIFCVIIIWGIYIIVDEYKTIGVYRMCGYSPAQIAASILNKHFLFSYIMSLSVALIFNLIIIATYNHLTEYFKYITICLALIVVFSITFFVVTYIIAILISIYVRIPNAIKGKKPYKIVIGINTAFKIVIGVALLYLLSHLIFLDSCHKDIKLNFFNWNILQSYGEFPIYTNPSIKNDYELGVKCKKLYEIESKRGAILIRPDGLLSLPRELYSPNDYDLKTNPNNPYFWRNNNVMINNNYLKLNPIYGENGTRIDLSKFEYEDGLFILVPEKYKEYEDILKQDFIETYTWSFYIDKDAYDKEIGVPAKHHEPKTVKIIYTQNDSSYFSFNPAFEGDKNYFYVDPIGIVVNSVNYGGDTYYSAISKGEFKVKLPSSLTKFDYFVESIRECGLEKNIVSVKNSYDEVDKLLYIIKQEAVNDIFSLILIIAVIIGISIFSTIMIVYVYRQKMSVQCMFGYSLFRRCTGQIAFTGTTWLAIFILQFVLFHNFSLFATLFGFLLIMVEILIVLVLKHKLSKKVLQRGDIF
ncbi:hypothetical protein EDD70_2806 [Hydrogenoanaerobacterium saccharovorans]|uniref:Bacteriocin-associated integral membrane (Putative immunity) protein n=1 Tax=Hydrogenoanaerobacterium saccharovorans TaxID=474960 RepID=A0A1H8E9Z6_9FIRM|nr:hypothetical protein [Hydrogenoanaerobacterium saccharovorans]RPF42064.1 hypothetical protein EDD70_2806 [Hydrogenoanaerobacterium saccharovorans]SEN16312.1 hypothetical protein SAMN05216180_2941 [Hydrogenoanaerobacterium saccharovorans]